MPLKIRNLEAVKELLKYEDLLAKTALLEDKNLQLEDKCKRLRERVAYLERMLYGSRRDKRLSIADQGPGLFDEEFNEALDEKAKATEAAAEEIRKTAEKRRAEARKTPARPAKYRYCGLEERVTKLYPAGVNVEDYDVIGCDETRILHRDPAKAWVEVIERPVLRRKNGGSDSDAEVIQAPAPRPVIGGNHVGADLLAQIAIDKYVYHLPEYRQVKRFADIGVTLPTSTLNDWVHRMANRLYPLYESLGEDIRSREYLQVDEVPWRIADKEGKCRKGYAWQFFDATPDSHGLYFHYHKGSRGGEVVRAQLKGYRGAIQTDGYKVYEYFEQQEGVILLGCLAHVRRKFVEAQKSHPDLAAKALEFLGLLYELEANLRAENASASRIAMERQAKAIPIMDTMEAWMKVVSPQCTPDDLMGKALDYAYKLWPRLRRYADDGSYQIDNNAVERMQRPSVLGRKNFLFSKNDRGAVDNAIFYSLLESCAVVGISPLQWLTAALDKLRHDPSEDEIIQMLPYYYKKIRADRPDFFVVVNGLFRMVT